MNSDDPNIMTGFTIHHSGTGRLSLRKSGYHQLRYNGASSTSSSFESVEELYTPVLTIPLARLIFSPDPKSPTEKKEDPSGYTPRQVVIEAEVTRTDTPESENVFQLNKKNAAKSPREEVTGESPAAE